MSDRPMAVPDGHEDLRYAELCILLPSDWKIEDGSYKLIMVAILNPAVITDIKSINTARDKPFCLAL